MFGRKLARGCYDDVIRPLLGDIPHAAAIIGDGSEVLGYDDAVSPDHDFGARVQIFAETDHDLVLAALRAAPPAYQGFPLVYVGAEDRRSPVPVVSTAEAFFAAALGFDPVEPIGLSDWLTSATQVLGTLTGGEVFHDPAGELAGRRAALNWYPDDVWRYVLASAWLRVDQEEPFIGRTGATGDDLGSTVIAARIARDLMRIGFLVQRRWAPYSKWLGRAFGELAVAPRVGPHLRAALTATGWREREAEICAAAGVLAEATNALDLAAPVDPAPRSFHTRDIQVLGSSRLTDALVDAITDPEVRSVTGDRLVGSVDQVVDSVDVLTWTAARRETAAVLGMGKTQV